MFIFYAKVLLRNWEIKSCCIFPPHLNSISAFSQQLSMSKQEFFFDKHGMKAVLLGYPTVSKMLAAIKHSAA